MARFQHTSSHSFNFLKNEPHTFLQLIYRIESLTLNFRKTLIICLPLLPNKMHVEELDLKKKQRMTR